MTGAFTVMGLHHLAFDGPMDVEYFCDIPNASVARDCLTFLEDGGNEISLHQRHTSSEVERMWRTTLRACLAHGVPISDSQKQYARMLGVVI